MTPQEMEADKMQELLNDVTDFTSISSCCDARVYCPSGDSDDAVCGKCGEPCSAIIIED